MKLISVLLTVVVTGAIVGLSVYSWQNAQNKIQTDTSNTQITTLQSRIASEKPTTKLIESDLKSPTGDLEVRIPIAWNALLSSDPDTATGYEYSIEINDKAILRVGAEFPTVLFIDSYALDSTLGRTKIETLNTAGSQKLQIAGFSNAVKLPIEKSDLGPSFQTVVLTTDQHVFTIKYDMGKYQTNKAEIDQIINTLTVKK